MGALVPIVGFLVGLLVILPEENSVGLSVATVENASKFLEGVGTVVGLLLGVSVGGTLVIDELLLLGLAL